MRGTKLYLRDFYQSHPFLRDIFTLMVGTVISQLIPIIISPLLTRIYRPEDFGVFALYVAVTQMIAVIATARYELAIMIPEKDEDAQNLLVLSLIITVIITFTSFFIVWIFNSFICRLVGNTQLSKWLYFVPLSVLFLGIFQALNYWFNRHKNYRIISFSKIMQAVVNGIANLGLGVWLRGTVGLIVGIILGQLTAAGVLSGKFYKSSRNELNVVSKENIKQQAKLYSDFPKINSLHAFIDILQLSVVVFIISAFFESTIVGFYALTLRVLKTPLNFIGKAVAQVFYQRATESYNKGYDLRRLVKKTVIRLAIVSLPFFLVLFLFAPSIFSLVFGKEWVEAGRFTQILTPWLLLTFVYSPVSQIPLIVNKQRIYLVLGLVYNLLIILIFFYAGYFQKNIYLGMYLLTGVMSLFLIILIIWLIKISKSKSMR